MNLLITVCLLSLAFFIVRGDISSDNFKKLRINKIQQNRNISIASQLFTPSTNFRRWKPRVMLILCATMYGSNYACHKLLRERFSSQFITSARFIIAAFYFLPVLLKSKGKIHPISGGVELGLLCSIGYISQAISLENCAASKVAIMSGLAVLFVPILECFLFKTFSEKSPSISFYISPIIAFIGLLALEWGGIDTPTWNDLQAIISPIFFGLNFLRAERIVRKFPEDTSLITGASILTVTLTTLAWALTTGEIFINSFTFSWRNNLSASLLLIQQYPIAFFGIIYLGLFVTALASTMEQISLKTLSASEITLIYTLEPLTGAAFANLFLHEHLGLNVYVGGLLITLACLYSILCSTVEPSS